MRGLRSDVRHQRGRDRGSSKFLRRYIWWSADVAAPYCPLNQGFGSEGKLLPAPLLHICAEPDCPELVARGRWCLAHEREHARHRGSAHSRGYTRRWREFKAWFIQRLIRAGIAPVCGARWPGEPPTGDSLCQRDGRLTAVRLHLDHTPPLTDEERGNEQAVCDEHRVQLLCEACHNAKTARGGEYTR